MLDCTLEELCYGGLEKIKLIRDVISNEGMIVQEEGGATNNKYEAGMKKTGTKATFEGKGGSHRLLPFSYSGYEKVIQVQGMSNAKGAKRGDLRITFLVNFPTELTDQQGFEAYIGRLFLIDH
ncbi:hypothetical protein QQP08_007172 [Theobroma cacao]|nr:hypothetical protein QQP08_007172 [Theobroma cacao]